jgi:2-amino-4-hydroxy-6-hydroxymethyldihydropteridine diphosphokinase
VKGPQRRAVLALGTNEGDRLAHLQGGLDLLRATPELVVLAVSPVYETDPVGGPAAQGPYLNLVVELDTELAPRDLLAVCHRLEAAAERVRTVRWGPRTLDVDILWIDGVEVDEPDLHVPHPRMFDRRFVLAPLGELAPELLPSGWEARAEGQVAVVGRL